MNTPVWHLYDSDHFQQRPMRTRLRLRGFALNAKRLAKRQPEGQIASFFSPLSSTSDLSDLPTLKLVISI